MTACTTHLRSHLLGLAVVVLGAQSIAQAPSAATEVPAPTIRVTTHMVLVDVVVTDKQGKPVTGLQPEDFAVEENGKAQKVASLSPPPESVASPPALPPGIY